MIGSHRARWIRSLARRVAVAACASLAACGGSGGDGGSAPAQTPSGTTVGGTATGVSANGRIALTDNGGDAITVASDGPFVFPARLATAASVAVSSTSADESCTVVRATVPATNAVAASHVQVACGPIEQKAFHPAATMRVPRYNHQLVKLDDGTIVAFGGSDDSITTPPPERYDTRADTWSTLPALPDGVTVARAVPLSGAKVLLFVDVSTGRTSFRAESRLYDTTTGETSSTGSFAQISGGYATVRLLDGRVLAMDSVYADVYDPATNRFTATAMPPQLVGGGVPVLMADGNVLIAGAHPAAIYDVQAARWSTAASPVHARLFPTAFLLPNGRVLVFGGSEVTGGFVKDAELFDPSSGQWTPAGSLAAERNNLAAALMPTGKVIATGGSDTGYDLPTKVVFPTTHRSTEAYDPTTNAWSAWADLAVPRAAHAAVATNDGKLLVTGGAVNTQAVPGSTLQPSSEIGW